MEINITEKGDAIAEREYSKNIPIMSYKELSDENLVRAFVENQEEEAFNEIVNRYANKVYRLAL